MDSKKFGDFLSFFKELNKIQEERDILDNMFFQKIEKLIKNGKNSFNEIDQAYQIQRHETQI